MFDSTEKKTGQTLQVFSKPNARFKSIKLFKEIVKGFSKSVKSRQVLRHNFEGKHHVNVQKTLNRQTIKHKKKMKMKTNDTSLILKCRENMLLV